MEIEDKPIEFDYELDFDAIAKEELNQVILMFEGWCEGYIHGAKLGEEPHIFCRVKSQLYDLQSIYKKKNNHDHIKSA